MEVYNVEVSLTTDPKVRRKGLLGLGSVVVGDAEHKLKINKIQIRESLGGRIYVSFPILKSKGRVTTIVAPADRETRRLIADAVLKKYAEVLRVEDLLRVLGYD